MSVRRITLRPHAKINLTLQVGPRRADGFHDVRTVLQSIALADRMVVEARRGAFTLTLGGAADVPADRTNLVWRAADTLWRAIGRGGDPQGAVVALHKTIPSAAGLGGGSADAAAALVALNAVWRGRRSRRALSELAAELGSDVPFFLQGGTALGAGRGEELYPLQDVGRLGVVVIKPSMGVSTADAYRWLDEDRRAHVEDADRSTDEVEVGWSGGPVRLVNDLQGPVVRRHPAIAEALAACRKAGASGVAMSGSGSAVFGLFSEAATARAARRLTRPDWLVVATRTLSRRESSRRMGL